MTYRHLTKEEISILEAKGNNAKDWSLIQVASEGFMPERVTNSYFNGRCTIGCNNGSHRTVDGISLNAGIYHATLIDCRVGDNVRICNVQQYILNYHIGDRSRIEGVGTMIATPGACCGQGTTVSVLNETGGREVIISDKLTAQTAYLMAFYRHDDLLRQCLKHAANSYAEAQTREHGEVADDVCIVRVGTIRNVCFRSHSTISGATVIEDGTVCSSAEEPSHIGASVIARHFIMAPGASITDGAQVDKCYIGQACHLGHLFSAHDSLFFANCMLENGESCAVFAGPYTVSMHKSSLLIAGFFSFLNAGSGSNQSNHLYKLGPIHQGIVERGSKTTSDSYILWPAHIGPFTLVMGRHVHHTDSSNFPFSYLIEDHGNTYLVPGANIRSVGTIRDAKKWPARDGRKGVHIDSVNYNLLSPFTVEKMLKGHRILSDLKAMSGGNEQTTYTYRDMFIRASALDKGLQYYSLGIDKFMGNSLITRLGDCPCCSDKEIYQALHTDTAAEDKWIDLSGMMAPRKMVIEVIEEFKNEPGGGLDQLNTALRRIHEDYYALEWDWSYPNLLRWYNLKPEELTRAKVAELVRGWLDAVLTLDKMLYEDAKKEFHINTRVGFGFDFDHSREDDYRSVRGTFEENPFVREVLEHIDRKRALGREILQRLS